MTAVLFKDASPCFLVPNVKATAEYYRDVLGFCLGDMAQAEPSFCMAFRDGATIVLQQGIVRVNGDDVPDAYVGVEDVKALAVELEGRGAAVIFPPTYRPIYNGWEMMVRDLDGRAILFTQAD